MMVRKEVFLLCVFPLFLILAFSLLSAGFFSNVYETMTGNAVLTSYTCSDSDANATYLNGDNPYVKGNTSLGSNSGSSAGIQPPSTGGLEGVKISTTNVTPTSTTAKIGVFTKIKSIFLPTSAKSKTSTLKTVRITSTSKAIINFKPKSSTALSSGTQTYNSNSETSGIDYCTSSNSALVEYYCNGSSIAKKTYTCNCADGRCVSDSAGIEGDLILCDPDSETDKLGGESSRWNYIHKGEITLDDGTILSDECSGDNLLEYACMDMSIDGAIGPTTNSYISSKTVTCLFGCENGHCKTCKDTDDTSSTLTWPLSYGKNPNNAGITEYTLDGLNLYTGDVPLPGQDVSNQDKCLTTNILTERYCERVSEGLPSNLKYRYIRSSYNITCGDGCIAGLSGAPDKCKPFQGLIQLKSPLGESVFGDVPIDFICYSSNLESGLNNVTLYTTIDGTFKEYSTLSGSAGYNCEGNKCFKFTLLKLPNQNYSDGVYKWTCKMNFNNNIYWADENRTFYLVNKTLLVYDGGMIANITNLNEDITKPNVDLSSFDNFFKFYVNGSAASKTHLLYSVYTSPSINVAFNSRTNVNLTGKTNFNGHTEIIFLATAEDNSLQMKPLGIDVSGINDAPILKNNLIQWRVNNSILVDLNGNYFEDPEGNALTYNWTSADSIYIRNISSSIFNFSSSPTFSGYRYINIIAKDSLGLSTTANMTLKVSSSNQAPVIHSYTPTWNSSSVALGQVVNFNINASDPDGDILNYFWSVYRSNGSFVTSLSNKSFSFSYSIPASFTIKVIVSDGEFSKYNSWVLVVGSGDDNSLTSTCGNGEIDLGEVCDGGLLNGATCQNQGYDSGEISCSSTCKEYDKTLCILENTDDNEPLDLDSVNGESNVGTILIWGLIIVLLILIIVGTILIIRIIKKRNAAVKSTQTWQQPFRPSGGNNFPSR